MRPQSKLTKLTAGTAIAASSACEASCKIGERYAGARFESAAVAQFNLGAGMQSSRAVPENTSIDDMNT